MRILRALSLLVVLGSTLLAAGPASAATAAPVGLTLAQRWSGGQQGDWTPYLATVRNDGGGDFTGDVVLDPVPLGRGAPATGWPNYRARVTVPGGASRAVTFYVVEPPAGYRASLLDSGGRTLVSDVTVNGLLDGGYAVAVLSDQPQAATAIMALKPLTSSSGFGGNGANGVRVTRFASAQDFPTNAVFLTGLAAVVIDDFDVSTLSDAQVRALHDFVGLGGSLVVAGGSAWRRTLLPLFQKGFPGLNPSRTGEAGLQALGDLGGQLAPQRAPVAIGDPGATRVLLGAPGEAPLVVEAGYGGGRVIDLLFDPLADPIVNDNTGLPAVAWNLALARAVADTGSGAVRGAPIAVPGGGLKPAAAGPPVADGIAIILTSTSAAAVPPIGLLGILLVVYVLLAGPLNYLALRGFRRRELMWVSVPLVALVFTGAAYVVGFAVHGSNYLDNEVQLLNVAPDGVTAVHAYHGLYPPHRGNFTVVVGANTLASTALGSSFVGPGAGAVVETGGRTQVELLDTSYGTYRSLQTMAIGRPPAAPALALEAHLRIAQNRVLGTVRNTGDRAVESLSVVSGAGQKARLAADLQPRATVTVDAPLSAAGNANNFVQPPNAQGASKRESLLRTVEGAAANGRAGGWSLTALTDPSGELTIDGLHPAHTGLAALIEPVALESVDSLTLARGASLVATGQTVPYHYDVIDLEVPAGYSGPVKLSFEGSASAVALQGPIRSLELYDWDTGGWRAATPGAATPGGRAAPISLNAGEARGAVRVRVSEQSDAALSTLRLVSS